LRKPEQKLSEMGRPSRTGDEPADRAACRYEFRTVVAGVETLSAHLSMPRHHHSAGYATVVLAGSIREVSFAGRMQAEPGEVLLHGRFDCHLDWASGRRSLQILRLPWKHDTLEGQYQVTDPDSLARLAETDPKLAAAQLYAQLRPSRARDRYWVDELAAALAQDDQGLPLRQWAEARGLRPDAVSRIFRQEFGVSPKRFRLESRTRLAWREVVGSRRMLTEIAFKSGFSDLAHLSRSVRIFTGQAPNAWRLNTANAC
jgi:AraC-like DNA-binding protein